MNKERVNGKGIQLSENDIFGTSQWYALTPLGSCFEGIGSIQKEDFDNLSNNGMSKDSRQEWKNDIEERFSKAGELMGIQIPTSGRESVMIQYREIVEKRVAMLTRMTGALTKS